MGSGYRVVQEGALRILRRVNRCSISCNCARRSLGDPPGRARPGAKRLCCSTRSGWTRGLPCLKRSPWLRCATRATNAFVLGVLTRENLPTAHLKQLQELAGDALGDHGAVYPRQSGFAAPAFWDIQRARAAGLGHQNVARIVLDDEDALSRDFIAEWRDEPALAVPCIPNARGYTFLSFSRRISLMHESRGDFSSCVRDILYTNLRLTFLGATNTDLGISQVAVRKLAIHTRAGPSMICVLPFFAAAIREMTAVGATMQRSL